MALAMTGQRLLVGKVMTVTVRGTPVKLEVGATGDARGMADGLARAKAAAWGAPRSMPARGAEEYD